jgi:hypothetical protein
MLVATERLMRQETPPAEQSKVARLRPSAQKGAP